MLNNFVVGICFVLVTTTVGRTEPPPEKAVPRRDAEFPPPEFIALLRPIHDFCIAQTGVTDEAIKEFSDGKIHEDPALKCYMACTFEKGEVMLPNGDVHLEKLYETLPDSMKKPGLKMGLKCIKNPSVGRCERAFWYHKCWKETDPVHYFII